MKNETIAPRQTHFNPFTFSGSVLIGAVSGGAAGLMAGLLARLAMRVVAVLGGMTPGFSIEGTLVILFICSVLGIGPGILYAISLPVWRAKPGRKGLVIGLILALILSVGFFSVEAEGELALIPIWMVAAMFGATAMVYGLVLGAVAGRLVVKTEAVPDETDRFLRTAGLLTLIGGLVSGSIELFQAVAFPIVRVVGIDTKFFLEGLAGVGMTLGIVTGLAGLLRSGAAGGSTAAKALIGTAFAGFTLLGLGSVFGGAGMMRMHGLVQVFGQLEFNPDLLILLVVLLTGVALLLAVGVAMLRARQWTGWRRFTPLAVGLVPALSIPLLHPSLLPALLDISLNGRNQLGHWVGAAFGLAWVALGMALRAEARQADLVSPASAGAWPAEG